ncbi:FecR family protein [Candidatus Symbiobacter mobilis]|uniref:FecR protein domain-containing protein n=1 Tax=Candidatus Symbiobacter mobilis CR TaxID=946483 RepID=U5N9F7_9BURK|nr:FecR domain-containing protein [Candidatus Symbiobacter mobilis]AGX87945.1 hypothetical protein Cenrod_1864 [Candidatus Symbiobacter mobilis CR]
MRHRTLQTTILVLLLHADLCGAAQVQRAGTIKSVQGDVRLLQQNTPRTVAPGAAVAEADRVVTGRNASATFTLRDGMMVTVGPNSTLDLAKVRFDPVTQEGSIGLSLLQGVVRVVTGVIGKLHPEQVEIATPTSVVGVRGTDFIVEVP